MSSPSVVGAIDQGTQSSRFILFDKQGKPVANHQADVKLFYPNPGWAEQDPMNIWESVQICMDKVMSQGFKASSIAGIGITNQRETTVIWDRETGKPIHNAIVWLDGRTKAVCERLAERTGSKDFFRPSSGLPISTYFSAIKLRWLIENVPKVKEAVYSGRAMFGTIDSWLAWNLTGGVKGGAHITDVTNASRTMLMNLSTCRWDEATCKYLEIPTNILPSIRSSAEIYGKVAEGQCSGVPVSGCIGDQQSALVGQLCFKPGEAKNTYGTGCFMLLNTGKKIVQSKHGLLCTVAYQLPGDQPVYALEGSVAAAGLAIKWTRDSLKLIASAAETEQLARSIPDTGGMYFVPAFSGLLSPYWRDDARCAAVGMSHYTGKAHFARAVLESTPYQTREVLDAMVADSPSTPLAALRVDGGMCANTFLMQFQADILGINVIKPKNIETTAAGAAYMAGLGVGFWKNKEELISSVGAANSSTVFKPQMAPARRAELYAGWKRAVDRSLGWVQNGKAAAPKAAKSTAKSTANCAANAARRCGGGNCWAMFAAGVFAGGVVTYIYTTQMRNKKSNGNNSNNSNNISVKKTA